jgi:hypothetical protein
LTAIVGIYVWLPLTGIMLGLITGFVIGYIVGILDA